MVNVCVPLFSVLHRFRLFPSYFPFCTSVDPPYLSRYSGYERSADRCSIPSTDRYFLFLPRHRLCASPRLRSSEFCLRLWRSRQSPLSRAEVKNAWSLTSTLTWRSVLVKDRDSFFSFSLVFFFSPFLFFSLFFYLLSRGMCLFTSFGNVPFLAICFWCFFLFVKFCFPFLYFLLFISISLQLIINTCVT